MILTTNNGILLSDGIPIKWMGVNAYSLYNRIINNTLPNTYIQAIDLLSNAGVKVIRIFCDGWDNTSGLGLWETNPTSAISALTLILDYLQTKNMGAILCVTWNPAKISLWKAEAESALVTNGSSSITYLQNSISTIVNNFKTHAACAAWSIGNELNALGIFSTLTSAQVTTLTTNIKNYISAADSSGRIIIADWFTVESTNTSGQSGEVPYIGESYAISRDSSFQVTSQHIYTDRTSAVGLNGSNFGYWLSRMAKLGASINKPFIVGEIGPTATDDATNQIQCQNITNGWVYAKNCQLALWWNIDVSDISGNQAAFRFWSDTKPWILTHLSQISNLPFEKIPLSMGFPGR